MSVHDPDLPQHVTNLIDYTRHEEYFIPSGDFNILARNTLFRVYSFFLARDSVYWRAIIEQLYSSDNAFGSSELQPFYLDEDPDNVAQFLSITYNRRYNIYDQTPDEWGAIFRLADRWDAPVVRRLAISRIQSAPMDIAEKIRVFLRCGAPREVYYPLMDILACHDELPEDLLPIFVSETEPEDIPEGTEIHQAPPPPPDENVFRLPSMASTSTESSVSEGSTYLTTMAEDENEYPLPISSDPNTSPVPGAEGQEEPIDHPATNEHSGPADVYEDGISDDLRSSCGDLIDRWVIVDGNQSEDRSLGHPSIRRPFMLQDFIIPYCLFVSVISAFLA